MRMLAVVAGAGLVAAAWGTGWGGAVSGFLLRPVVSLGLVTAATTVIVRRAWRRADASGDTPRRRHALAAVIRPHRRRFAFAALTSFLAQLAEMTLGVFIATIAVVLMKGESQMLLRLGIAGAGAQLWSLAAATAAVCAVVAGLSYVSGLAWRRLAQDVQYDWRNSTFAHAQRLPLSGLEGRRTSRVTAVLTDDVGQLGSFVAGTMPEIVQMATSVLVLVPAFLIFAPQIAWVAFLPVPLVAWLSFRFHESGTDDYAAAGDIRARMHSRVANALQANATVKAACAEDHEDRRLAELGDDYRESTQSTDRSTVQHTEAVRLCTTASMAGTLLFGGRAVLAGELPFQAFSPLVGLPQQMLWRLTRLGATTDQYRRMLDSFDRIAALHDLPQEPATVRESHVAQVVERPVAGEFVFDRVTFGYADGPPVLRDLSLRFAAGKVTGIVGPTGSGKSTIAKLLMRFEEPDAGRILLDGRDLRHRPLHELRSTVGFVAQEPFLFDGTIADNVRYGSFEADDLRVVAATRMAEADAFIRELPEREHTFVGERGSSLSGGQKQRIALARAFVRNPPVVVLDEATSAVDNGTEAAIQRALKAFGAGRTMVVIAHRLSTVRDADWIYVLDCGGVLAEQGTHAQLVRRGGVYAHLWRLQAGERAAHPRTSGGGSRNRGGERSGPAKGNRATGSAAGRRTTGAAIAGSAGTGGTASPGKGAETRAGGTSLGADVKAGQSSAPDARSGAPSASGTAEELPGPPAHAPFRRATPVDTSAAADSDSVAKRTPQPPGGD
ncbi:MAG TPA: ATP-binding cassette domain-containing protein [Yinghuangia sp.]|nr:ATP-binding cassette domain-containing protein [Yinghuangia sp.]